MSRYRNNAYDHNLIEEILEDTPSGSEEDKSDDENLVIDRFTGCCI